MRSRGGFQILIHSEIDRFYYCNATMIFQQTQNLNSNLWTMQSVRVTQHVLSFKRFVTIQAQIGEMKILLLISIQNCSLKQFHLELGHENLDAVLYGMCYEHSPIIMQNFDLLKKATCTLISTQQAQMQTNLIYISFERRSTRFQISTPEQLKMFSRGLV